MKSLKLPLYLAGFLLMPAFLSAQTTFLSVDANAGTSATQSGFTGIGLTVGSGTGPYSTSFTGLSTAYTATGTVGLTLTFNSGTGLYTARERTGTAADTGSFTYNGLYRDFVNASASGGNLTFGFTGLLANTTYQLRFYAYDVTASASRTMTFTDWTSGSAGTGASTGSITYTSGSTFTGAAGDNYLYSTLITATTDSSGNLSIRETMGGSYAALFNGFEISSISSVPEPSTYAAIFGTLALAGAVAFRRHRQN